MIIAVSILCKRSQFLTEYVQIGNVFCIFTAYCKTERQLFIAVFHQIFVIFFTCKISQYHCRIMRGRPSKLCRNHHFTVATYCHTVIICIFRLIPTICMYAKLVVVQCGNLPNRGQRNVTSYRSGKIIACAVIEPIAYAVTCPRRCGGGHRSPVFYGNRVNRRAFANVKRYRPCICPLCRQSQRTRNGRFKVILFAVQHPTVKNVILAGRNRFRNG